MVTHTCNSNIGKMKAESPVSSLTSEPCIIRKFQDPVRDTVPKTPKAKNFGKWHPMSAFSLYTHGDTYTHMHTYAKNILALVQYNDLQLG